MTENTPSIAAEIVALITSKSHNYVGHYGGPSGDEPAIRHPRVELVPGRGIVGDRFVEREVGHGKQITFFEIETLNDLSAFAGRDVAPESVRRNVFTRGVELNGLVGKRFRLQGVTFEGTQHCHPCFWMDEAVVAGAEEFLKMRGGLRARILDGVSLTLGRAEFVVLGDAVP